MASPTLNSLLTLLGGEGKALPAPPAAEASPVLVAPARGRRISGAHLDAYLGAYGGNNAIDWVMDCVRLIMETASNAEYHFERAGETLAPRPSPALEDSVELAPQDLVSLVEQPNPYQDWVEFLELTIIDWLLTGNFYWLKFRPEVDTGKPLALYRLSPALTAPIPGENVLIAGYEYRPPGIPEPIRYPYTEVIHGRLANPHDPYLGLGVVAGAPRAFDLELALTETQAAFFERGTQLSGVLETDRRVPDPVFEKIKRQFAAMYSGKSNAHKVAVLQAGLSFKSIQANAAEAQFEALAKLSRDRIAHMFRVPLPLLGNLENANYKMSEAQRVFDTKTMRPLLNKLQKRISQELTQAWGVDFVIDYQYVMPDEDRLKLATEFATLPGVKVVEVRKQAGLDPLDDERDDIVLNIPSEEPTRGRGSEAGRPPNGENAPTFPEAGGELPAGARAQRQTSAKDAEALPLVRPTPENPDPLQPARDAAVAIVATDILTELREAAHDLERGLMDTLAEGKDLKKADRPSLVERLAAAPAWGRFLERLRAALFGAAVRSVQDADVQHRLIGLEREDANSTEEIARDLIDRPNGIRSIEGTLRELVSDIVAEGVRRGYSVDQMLDGVPAEDYAGLRDVTNRWATGQAETIALTEAQEYHNEGAVRVAEANGLNLLVSDGHDFDTPCVEADGQIWPPDYARDHRTEHPRCQRGFVPTSGEVTAHA